MDEVLMNMNSSFSESQEIGLCCVAFRRYTGNEPHFSSNLIFFPPSLFVWVFTGHLQWVDCFCTALKLKQQKSHNDTRIQIMTWGHNNRVFSLQ